MGSNVIVGIDVGGTFTDVVYSTGNGDLTVLKVPSTRPDPSQGIIHGLSQIADSDQDIVANIAKFVHGTTVATNAVLERKGARVGLLVTEGFRDVLEVGREFRHDMYNVFIEPATPVFIAPRSRRIGIPERMGPDGEIITPLDEDAVFNAAKTLLDDGVEAIAVSFLFSHVNPAHELRVREILQQAAPQIAVSLSHEVDPSFREYERTSITAFDAYVKPTLDHYLNKLSGDLLEAGVNTGMQVMQSRGGIASSNIAIKRPVRLFLSGPAGGVIGARESARVVGEENLITFDVGGTSCDISLIEAGSTVIKPHSSIDGFVVRVPMIDVNAIGSGGGSIAWLDAAGGLRVGPHSAGSTPGPACYAKGGTLPTVTDASLVLGYIDPDYFANGTLKLSLDLATEAIKTNIADPLGMTVEEAALGIHRIVNSQMAEGIRMVSIKRGIDPRELTLMPLGGGGGIHATALARELGMRKILVPLYPGVLAATGLLAAPIEHEVSSSFQKSLSDCSVEELTGLFADLRTKVSGLMAEEGINDSDFETSLFADVCFIGQSHFVEVEIKPEYLQDGQLFHIAEEFVNAHRRIYGYGEDAPVRLVNLRTVATQQSGWSLDSIGYEPAEAAPKASRQVLFDGQAQRCSTSVHARHSLKTGETISGPAILEQSDTTTIIEPGWKASVLAGGIIMMEHLG